MDIESTFDLIIIGAGPAGLSAALSAQKNNLNYILLEKTDHLADTIYCYQKKKFVMVEPMIIPLRGELWMQAALREDILEHWSDAARNQGLNIMFNAPLTEIVKANGSFHVKTDAKVFEAGRVILAMGTQGTSRKLAVPGEDLPHVLPRLIDPDMYSDQDILVVGGGDSAIEIAVALAVQNRVTMSVITSEFIRVKASLERQALDNSNRGEMTIYFNSAVDGIDSESVTLKLPSSTIKLKAQVVIVKIGTLPPRSFLEKCGVTFLSPEPNSPPVLSPSYETNSPGLFLIGAVNGRGDLIKYGINHGYEVIEHICGRKVEPADEELLKEKLDFLTGTVSERIKAMIPQVPILSGATEIQIRELLLSSQFHRVLPGEITFRQNDYSESLYIILEGIVEVLVKPDDGPEKLVGRLGPGLFFGELSLIAGRRRSATIRAAGRTFLWEVSRKAMLKFVHTTPHAKNLIDKTFLVHAFQSHFFPNFDYKILLQLADHAKVLRLEKGGIVIKEGDPGDAFYFLRSGKVKISMIRDRREIVVAYLSAGQYFGEMALLSGEPRVATVTAIDKVEVIQLMKEDFLGFLEVYPELKERIEREVRRRQISNIEVEARPELGELGQFMVSEEVVVGDNVLLIDEDRCVHCDNCVKACEGVHEDGQTRIKRTGIKFANILVANSCRHCENPLCMTDCPPGDAIVRDPRGEVYIRDNCIGCGNCASNCPYDNIFMVHPEEKLSPFEWVKAAVGMPVAEKKESSRSIAVKCDLCHGLNGGPACVRSCPTGAVLRLSPKEYNQKIESLVLQRKGMV